MVSAPDLQTAKGGSFRAGDELRAARERLGWDLGDVAAALRIKHAYLQAIEDGRIAALPGNAYALGFLRTYATTLGLDADDIARRFRAEAEDVNRRPVLSFPAPVPERGVPTSAMILLGLVVAAVAYVGWLQLTDRRQLTAARTVPAVPDQLLGSTKAPPLSPQVASVMPRPGTAVPSPLPPTATTSPTAAETAPTPQTAPSATPSALAGVPVTPPTATPPTAAPASTPTAPQPAPAATTATSTGTPAAPASHLALIATGITWVQVRSPDGHVVWDHVMQPGEHWDVPTDPPGLTLTTGNAGGLEIATDGKAGDVLGRVGAVRRDIPLAEASAQTTSAAPPATPAAPATAAAPTPSTPTPETPPPAPKPHVRPHPKPAPAPSSADDLNARQLEKLGPTTPPSH